jgi:hypothetical protein
MSNRLVTEPGIVLTGLREMVRFSMADARGPPKGLGLGRI